MFHWFQRSLTRKFGAVLGLGAAVASLCFLVLFVGIYRAQLEQERGRVSTEVNRLLRASLENAMLKVDLPGIRDILQRLGEQEDIRLAMIVDPFAEVRFSSDPALLGRRLAREGDGICAACPDPGGDGVAAHFTVNEQGHQVLRSVALVPNQPRCARCHGPPEDSPINGVLFVDYDAVAVRAEARAGGLLLAAAGGVVLFLVLGLSAWLLRRMVLVPLQALAGTGEALAGGDYGTRVPISGHDEIARLGTTFNTMAERIHAHMDELERRDEFLQQLIDAVPDGIRVIDREFRVHRVNRSFVERMGLEPEAVLKAPCHVSSHRRDTPCPPTLETCPLHEIALSGKPIKVLQQHLRGDGGVLHVEIYSAPLDLAGHPPLIVQSIRDLQESIQFSQEQKLSALGELAAGVAHEIHNPLGSIRLALQSVLRDFGARHVDLESIHAYLRLMDGEIDKCIDVTRRMLRLSHTSEEREQLVPVNPAVEETLSLLRFEADKQGVECVLELDPSGPRVVATDSELRMLTLNLIQNAFHAMPEGGRLVLRARRVDGRVQLDVEDTGRGIPAPDLAHIFDPFFSRRADGQQGTGLGLNICKTIAERYGGRIQVRSRVGAGTRFRVVFPDPDPHGVGEGRIDDGGED